MRHLLARVALSGAGLFALSLSGGTAEAQSSPTDTIVQFAMNVGIPDPANPGSTINGFQVELYNTAAPATVANFLHYATTHLYDTSIFHRDVPGFVLQGGGFVPQISNNSITALNPIPTFAPVVNEFSPTRSNLTGTIAMAKLGGDPNSATDQFFFNLGDNSANLDTQNGGFTVFGKVLGNGMTLINAIATQPQYNLNPTFYPQDTTNGPFNQVPLYNNGTGLFEVTSVTVVPEPASLGVIGLGAVALLARRRRARA